MRVATIWFTLLSCAGQTRENQKAESTPSYGSLTSGGSFSAHCWLNWLVSQQAGAC